MQNSHFSYDESFFASGVTDTNNVSSSPNLSSPLSGNNGGGFFSKGGIGKQSTKRRSRASKKAPTTLLMADANNFRALVQQFTGCHSAGTMFGPHKGPINLNFEKPDHQVDYWNEESARGFLSFGKNNVNVVTTSATTTIMDDRELFVSNKPRPDPLTLDDFDIPEMVSEYALPAGTTEDDFWR